VNLKHLNGKDSIASYHVVKYSQLWNTEDYIVEPNQFIPKLTIISQGSVTTRSRRDVYLRKPESQIYCRVNR